MKKNCYFIILLIMGAGLISGCKSSAPRNLSLEEVRWARLEHDALGFSFKYPDCYIPEEYYDGRTVLFKHADEPVMRVVFADEIEDSDRGLWFGHEPQGVIELDGKSGHLYVYHHFNGPFHSRIVSHVIEHKGKFLALEFRSADGLDEVQKEILRSFSFSTESKP
jgi:hypothetical protein